MNLYFIGVTDEPWNVDPAFNTCWKRRKYMDLPFEKIRAQVLYKHITQT